MGTKTVRIPNQCSHSSTVPGKSRGDTGPQTAHHHGRWGGPAGGPSWVAMALLTAGLSWEQRTEKEPVPKPCHPVTITNW